MAPRSPIPFLLFLCLAALSGSLQAQQTQTGKSITIRFLDSRTGSLITPTGFLIRVNHQQTEHADWVQQNEDGSGKLTLQQEASLLTAHATYDRTMSIYVNCDSTKDRPAPVDHWYAVTDILKSGVVAPNDCSRRTAQAKPGEFVVFVRKVNWREQMQQDY
jgi:hypothetical protein